MADRPDIFLARTARKRLKDEYAALFEDLSALLYQVDPMGLNFGVTPDEYEPEVGTILPRIFDAQEPDVIAAVIREEFDVWFGRHRIEAATFQDLAEEVLLLLERYRHS